VIVLRDLRPVRLHRQLPRSLIPYVRALDRLVLQMHPQQHPAANVREAIVATENRLPIKHRAILAKYAIAAQQLVLSIPGQVDTLVSLIRTGADHTIAPALFTAMRNGTFADAPSSILTGNFNAASHCPFEKGQTTRAPELACGEAELLTSHPRQADRFRPVAAKL
jgi:hypothetical protein